MHACTHVRSSVPSERSRKNGMRNGRIMRHIAGLPHYFQPPTCSRTGKSFSIDDGRIVSTIEPLFSFSFFVFVGQKKIGISIIIRFVRGRLLVDLQLADNSVFKLKNISEW